VVMEYRVVTLATYTYFSSQLLSRACLAEAAVDTYSVFGTTNSTFGISLRGELSRADPDRGVRGVFTSDSRRTDPLRGRCRSAREYQNHNTNSVFLSIHIVITAALVALVTMSSEHGSASGDGEGSGGGGGGEEDNSSNTNRKLNFGAIQFDSWNCGGSTVEAKVAADELMKHVLVLSETRHSCHSNVDGCYESVPSKSAGVIIRVSDEVRERVIGFRSDGERIVMVRIKGPLNNLAVVGVYGPTNGHAAGVRDEF
jgi:hypothetical protein